jgi:hypothetical protein
MLRDFDVFASVDRNIATVEREREREREREKLPTLLIKGFAFEGTSFWKVHKHLLVLPALFADEVFLVIILALIF